MIKIGNLEVLISNYGSYRFHMEANPSIFEWTFSPRGIHGFVFGFQKIYLATAFKSSLDTYATSDIDLSIALGIGPGKKFSSGNSIFPSPSMGEGVKKSIWLFFASFRRKPESSVFKALAIDWTPVFIGVTA